MIEKYLKSTVIELNEENIKHIIEKYENIKIKHFRFLLENHKLQSAEFSIGIENRTFGEECLYNLYEIGVYELSEFLKYYILETYNYIKIKDSYFTYIDDEVKFNIVLDTK